MSDQLGDIVQHIVAASTALVAGQTKDLGEQLVPPVEKLHLTMAEMAASRKVDGELLPPPPPTPLDPEAIQRISAQLGQLARGLKAIGQAIVSSANAPPKYAPPPPQQDMAPLLQGIEKAMATMAQQAPAAGTALLGPYLEGLNQTLSAMGQVSATKVVQSLGPGVHDILNEMVMTAEGDTLRAIDRRIKSAGLPPDKNLGALINKTLKNFDMMKDLMKSLRQIDTAGLGGEAMG